MDHFLYLYIHVYIHSAYYTVEIHETIHNLIMYIIGIGQLEKLLSLLQQFEQYKVEKYCNLKRNGANKTVTSENGIVVL